LLTCIFAIFLGIFVYLKSPTGELNSIFLLLSISVACWTFIDFEFQTAESFERAQFWLSVSSLVIFVVPLLLHFILVLTEQKKLLNHQLTYLSLYGSALVFFLLDLMTSFEPEEREWGWTYNIPNDSPQYIFIVIWYSSIAILSLFFCIQYYLTIRDDYTKKQQIKYIIIGLSFPVIISAVTGFILPLFEISIPDLTTTSITITCGFFGYAIWKYELFILSPTTAADEIIATITDAIFLLNSNMEIVTVNQGALTLLGYQEHELIGKNVDIIFTKTGETIKDQSESFLSDIEATFQSKTGRNIPVSLSTSIIQGKDGKPQGVIFFGRDITARKQQEETILKSEIRYRSLFEQSNDAIFLISLEDTFLDVNQEAANILGYERSKLIGMPIQQVIVPSEYEDSFEKLDILIAGEKPTLYIRTFRKKDGQTFPGEVNISLVKDIDGNALYTQSIVRDITKRQQKEEEIKRAYLELQDFAWIVSHDLKAPLRGITTLADWLLRDYKHNLDSKGQELFTLLIERTKRMYALIEGILNYSRIGRERTGITAVNLNEVVTEVIDMLTPPAHINIQIETELPIIQGEKTQFFQVFQNLVSNAIRFMDKEQGVIVINCKDEDKFWQFSVTDNGPGIAEQHHNRIFQMFQTLTPEKHPTNTGIGLTLVKKIVQENGGKIWVESIVGIGSTFKFTLPKMLGK
ncbi:MAG: PAS domain S-box protein, partial [Promethearchaeota archaeon]